MKIKMSLIPLFTLFLSSLIGVEKIEDSSNLKILTPSLSQRKELKLRLDNGLEAYLISDPNSHDSGAALAVEAGSFDDPKQYPGLAHFVEHMLFMGTEKFPEKEGFHSYISSHSGVHNAFTTDKRTVFIFSIENGAFGEALDRFSQFFISPLFKSESLASECHAVDQEFNKDLTLDPWRILHVKKTLSNPSHPFHSFSIGNKETLSELPRDKMEDWYKGHYSASLMHLVVYSSLPIDELEKQVVTLFSPIPDRKITPTCCAFPIFSPDTQSTVIAIAPKHNTEKLELSWEMPRTHNETKEEMPEELIAYVLGYEGTGSLLTELKKENLVTAISTEVERLGREEVLFNLSFSLTSTGVKNYEEIITRTFQTLKLLQNSGIPKYIFDEMEKVKKLEYAFQQKEELFKLLSDLAYKLPDEELSTFPRLALAPTKYDEKKIKNCLISLTPDACRYFLIVPPRSLSQKMDKVEKWMGVNFALLPVDKQKMEQWANLSPHKAITLPKPNRFLPDGLAPIAQTEEKSDALPTPNLLLNDDKTHVFFAKDHQFLVPEVEWLFTFKTPSIRDADPLSSLFADLYTKIIRDRLREMAYDASLAHLNYRIAPTHNGLKLEIQGFSEKAPLFYSKIVEELASFSPTEEEFLLYKKELEKEYENVANESPIAMAKELTLTLLYKEYSGPTDKSKMLANATFKDFSTFTDNLFKEGKLEATLFGDMDEAEARKLIAEWEKRLPYKAALTLPTVEMALLPNTPSYLVKKGDQTGNALILVVDASPFNAQREAVALILSKMIEEPFFSEMRSKQETAYFVRNYTKEMERHLYLFFLIQSSSHDPRDLLSRFELFFENELRHFATSFPKETFDSVRKSEIIALTHEAENIADTGSLLNALAFDYDGDFDWEKKRIKALETLTYEDFEKEARSILTKDNGRRLASAVQGKMTDKEILSYQRISSLKKIRNDIQYQGKNLTE